MSNRCQLFLAFRCLLTLYSAAIKTRRAHVPCFPRIRLSSHSLYFRDMRLNCANLVKQTLRGLGGSRTLVLLNFLCLSTTAGANGRSRTSDQTLLTFVCRVSLNPLSYIGFEPLLGIEPRSQDYKSCVMTVIL